MRSKRDLRVSAIWCVRLPRVANNSKGKALIVRTYETGSKCCNMHTDDFESGPQDDRSKDAHRLAL